LSSQQDSQFTIFFRLWFKAIPVALLQSIAVRLSLALPIREQLQREASFGGRAS
jgi:hypothetical protein